MLNPQQTAAIHYLDGPLLVLAGAGSGKTSVITQKIAYLIKQCSYAAKNITAVTFTNKAATEMNKRVSLVLEPELRRGLQISTFHTLGLKIIKKNAALCNLAKGFSIFDSDDCIQILRGLLQTSKASDQDYIRALQQQISQWKNLLLAPNSTNLISTIPEAIELYTKYQNALNAYNAVDFDDLIRLPVDLLRNNQEVLYYWQTKIRYLLIDEYQDSNVCQYELVKLLVGSRAALTVVGDDDQSIYAWRGARPENLTQLQQDYPQLKVIKLEQNYRSTGRILHTANNLIAHNPHVFEKKLWSELGHGDLLRVICCRDEQHEAEQVTADLISHKLRSGGTYNQYAILYRGNHQSKIFEKILRQHGIAYHISGGQSWFSRSEIKDVFAYLKLLCNPLDDAAFLRVIQTPKRGIGDTTLHTLGQYARSRQQSLYQCCDHMGLSMNVSDKPRAALQEFKQWFEVYRQLPTITESILRDMLQESGYETYLYEQSDTTLQAQKRMEQVSELLAWVGRLMEQNQDHELVDVVNKLILIDILDQNNDTESDVVQLMTLHAAKGLEFPYVYLVGMEEDLLPHRVSIEADQIEEERRLAYVGITRAQKGLCLTLSRQRRRAGELHDCTPSRFLDELPSECLEWFGKNGERDEIKSKAVAKSHLDGLRNLLHNA
jgi:ATP-dependent DNA helicase Rep